MTLFGERYEVGALIGASGMSDVFVAKDLRLNRSEEHTSELQSH